MVVKTFIAGFGGQGVLSMGYTLATAAMLQDLNVTYFPAYGAEVRGGTAHCTISIGDEEIVSPVASEPEYVIALNTPSMLKFQNAISSGGQMFLNTTLIEGRPGRGDIEVIEIPATTMAEQAGNIRSANMIMLGAYVFQTRVLKRESIYKAIDSIFASKKKLIDVNKQAFDQGFAYLGERKGAV